MYLLSILVAACTLSSAFAAPSAKQPRRPKASPVKPAKPTSLALVDLQTKQPTDNLPSNSNVTLQFVGLGVGVQNYSCASTTSAPKSIGAIATLFDITALLQHTADVTSNLTTDYLKLYQKKSCVIDASNLADDSCEESINILQFPILGKHYFANINGAAVPSFAINNGDFLSAQKVGDVAAPVDAYDGSSGAGAVDWLLLVADGTGRSVGLSEVYRINTAGGAPESTQCSTGVTQFSVKYAAEYWFYD